MQKVDKEIIEDISNELGIHPSFIEKDLYVVEILDILSKFQYENAILVFSGGTSLSKGYGLIKRFSEDIDFRISTAAPINRTKRKEIRQLIIDKLKKSPHITVIDSSIHKANEDKFFSFYIEYPRHFELSSSLRPNLQVEFSFEDVLLPTKERTIKSIIGEYVDGYDAIKANCISPIETGANKFSALLWRIDIKDREKESKIHNDPGLMRHLHDLAALENLIMNDEFITTVKNSFELDKGRKGSNTELSLIDFATMTCKKLSEDAEYAKEYELFVNAVSYAPENELITFNQAIKSLETLIGYIKNQI